MPQLIAVDLYIGRRLRLGEVRHRISRFEANGAALVLVVDDGTHRLVSISKAELYARLCQGVASLESPFSVGDVS